jgi:hypothetical protein
MNCNPRSVSNNLMEDCWSQRPGTGGEFVVELPLLDAAVTEAAPSATRQPIASPRILVVDDNGDAA